MSFFNKLFKSIAGLLFSSICNWWYQGELGFCCRLAEPCIYVYGRVCHYNHSFSCLIIYMDTILITTIDHSFGCPIIGQMKIFGTMLCTLCQNQLSFIIWNYVASTALSGIVFAFQSFFPCIFIVLLHYCVVYREFLWPRNTKSDQIMIIGWLYQE